MYKIVWGIYYTSYQFERCLYMSVGFETKESAQNELCKILRERNKSNLPHTRVRDIENAGLHVPSVLTGTNWRIKKIKIKVK